MSNLIIKEESYENYGKCLSISNGICELFVTLELGPRIIKYNLTEKKNVFFNDLEREFTHNEESIHEMYGGGDWFLYGGHRFWISPESLPLTYYPDNFNVDYEISGNTVTFTPPVQISRKLQLRFIITMSGDSSEVTVTHSLENKGDKTEECAIWALSVMAPGGFAIVPHSEDQTGFLANRTLMFWPYNKANDKRFILGEKFCALKQDKNADKAFKIGTNNTKGVAAYVNEGCMFKVEYKSMHNYAEYPDNNVSTEVYTNHAFLELETLGALRKLLPGDRTEHTEKWSLTDAVSVPEYTETALAAAYSLL